MLRGLQGQATVESQYHVILRAELSLSHNSHYKWYISGIFLAFFRYLESLLPAKIELNSDDND